MRHRNPRKTLVSKTARLEEKLDGLVSLLKAGTQSSPSSADVHVTHTTHNHTHLSTIQTNNATSPHIQTEKESVTGVLDYNPHNLQTLTPSISGSEDTSRNSLAPVLPCLIEPSLIEAEDYLTFFKSYKSKYFPFVYIPSTTTAQQLRQERPFLWLCIMTISSRSTLQQQLLGSKIRHTLAEEMLLESGKTIDLLLGLLAYIGWYSITEP